VDEWFPIHTPRLLLRPFTERDESDVHGYGSDPVVAQYTDWGPNTPAQTRNRIQGYLKEQVTWPRDEVHLAVELRKESKVIGTIRLKIQDEQTRAADFGFVFHRQYWNQGYATEAAGAVLRVAFTMLGLHRVWATCDTRNLASWRVMEKVGMRREAMFRKDTLQKGQWRDSYLYAMLEDDEAVARLS
jgi:[ribosomal protein S5]-alanine N-acetyltransferase